MRRNRSEPGSLAPAHVLLRLLDAPCVDGGPTSRWTGRATLPSGDLPLRGAAEIERERGLLSGKLPLRGAAEIE